MPHNLPPNSDEGSRGKMAVEVLPFLVFPRTQMTRFEDAWKFFLPKSCVKNYGCFRCQHCKFRVTLRMV